MLGCVLVAILQVRFEYHTPRGECFVLLFIEGCMYVMNNKKATN